MAWWNTAAPYLEAAGVVVALVLGVANLVWLCVQGRRSKVTHALAVEAHDWAREKREVELREARERRESQEREAARLAFWEKTKTQLESARAPIDIPAGTPAEWVLEGEARGYFDRIQAPGGDVQLFRTRLLR